MKKLLLVSAIALFGAMNAQKNTLLIGGDISYSNSKETIKSAGSTIDGTADVFSFNPTIGYQFTDNWTAGVRLGINTQKGTANVSYGGTSIEATTKTNTFQYGVFGRYTMPLNETFAVYGDLDIYGMNSKDTTPDTSSLPITYSTTKKSGFGMTFTPNLFINFKNSFGLNFNIGGLGYEHSSVKDADDKTNTFGFGFGKGVTVGISKNFGLK